MWYLTYLAMLCSEFSNNCQKLAVMRNETSKNTAEGANVRIFFYAYNLLIDRNEYQIKEELVPT